MLVGISYILGRSLNLARSLDHSYSFALVLALILVFVLAIPVAGFLVVALVVADGGIID